MSFLNKYNQSIDTIIMAPRTFKNDKKIRILIKLFDRPARKSLNLLNSIITINEWYLTSIPLTQKYELKCCSNLIKSFNNINL